MFKYVNSFVFVKVYVFGGFGPPPDKQYQDILGKVRYTSLFLQL